MIYGYDIANVNGPNFEFPEDAELIVAKVTQDARFIDKEYSRHRGRARELGIPFGGYHYLDISSQPNVERSLGFFLENLGDQEEGEFAALDAEQDFGSGGLIPGDERNQPYIIAWGAGFARAKNYKAKLYTSVAGLRDFNLQVPEIAEYFDLWLAWWSNSGTAEFPPPSPSPFQDAGFKLWQYNADGIDKDVFLGTADELRATGHRSAPQPTSVDYEAAYWTPVMTIMNNMIANPTHRHADQALHAIVSNAITANKIAHGVESPF